MLNSTTDEADISIHALREEGDNRPTTPTTKPRNFYPRPPRGGRHTMEIFGGNRYDFYPRPPRGGRPSLLLRPVYRIGNFYPRPPRGGRRFPWSRASFASKFLSTPSARRATYEDTLITPRVLISIHALREEGDALPALVRIKLGKFLSTPSARRATLSGPRRSSPCFISIHALREEGDQELVRRSASSRYFYPRPPRGGRRDGVALGLPKVVFLSTPSARRATCIAGGRVLALLISIHALREEGDCLKRRAARRPLNFYPRPPRGGRQSKEKLRKRISEFLSTPSARRATPQVTAPAEGWAISIHALREEGDVVVGGVEMLNTIFLSTPSARRATCHASRLCCALLRFLSTPSARRATTKTITAPKKQQYFYPRPPRGGRRAMQTS